MILVAHSDDLKKYETRLPGVLGRPRKVSETVEDVQYVTGLQLSSPMHDRSDVRALDFVDVEVAFGGEGRE